MQVPHKCYYHGLKKLLELPHEPIKMAVFVHVLIFQVSLLNQSALAVYN